MSKNGKRFMRKFIRQLRKCLELEASHCGHDVAVAEADGARYELEWFVRCEIVRLSNKAGEK